jgi:hypothetical protein
LLTGLARGVDDFGLAAAVLPLVVDMGVAQWLTRQSRKLAGAFIDPEAAITHRFEQLLHAVQNGRGF